MSVSKDVQTHQLKKRELSELNDREWIVVQLFRLLDEVSQEDIIRFLNAFLVTK